MPESQRESQRVKASQTQSQRAKESQRVKESQKRVNDSHREAKRGNKRQREPKRVKESQRSQRESESVKERQRELKRATESQREAKKVVLTTTMRGHFSSHFGLADEMPGWHPERTGLAPIRPSGLGAKYRFLAANQQCWEVINAQI